MRKRGVSLVELISALAIIGGVILLLLPAIVASRETARGMECRNNIKQLSLSLLNYHHDYQVLPPGYTMLRDRQGLEVGPGLSWGALLLPFAEQNNLSNMIVPDAPLASAENATVCRANIKVFTCPSDLRNEETIATTIAAGGRGPLMMARSSFIASFGTGDPMTLERGDGMFGRNRSWRIEDMLDGTSTTFLLGERRADAGSTSWAGGGPELSAMVLGSTWGDAGPNGRPPRRSGYSSRHPGGSHFAYGDGSVRFVTDAVGKPIYAALATRWGGEVVSDFENW